MESTSEARVSHARRHPAWAEESGQVLVLAAVSMVMLLAVTGFALDIGHAYLVQRQLQAGVDAAASPVLSTCPWRPRSSRWRTSTVRQAGKERDDDRHQRHDDRDDALRPVRARLPAGVRQLQRGARRLRGAHA